MSMGFDDETRFCTHITQSCQLVFCNITIGQLTGDQPKVIAYFVMLFHVPIS